MAGTKIIKQKIKAITSIKKITKTMEMISFVKMKKATEDVKIILPYMVETKRLIESIESEFKDISHNNAFFLNNKNKNTEVVCIFASNKGLCGSFNSNIYKKTKKYLDERKAEGVTNFEVIAFGKFADKIAKRLGAKIIYSFHDIEKIKHLGEIYKLEKILRDKFLKGEVGRVSASYTNFIKNGAYENKVVSLYPIKEKLSEYTEIFGDNSGDETPNYQIMTFEPDAETLINKLIPRIVSTLMYSYILESRASEYSQRSFAMKRANESAGEMLGTLKLKYNRVRQDGITQEIAEISAGSAG